MFSNLFKAVVGTVLLPIDLVKDTVTLGGACTDGESAIVNRCRTIGKNLEKATDPDEDDE